MTDTAPVGELRLALDPSQISAIIAGAIRTDHHKESDPEYGVVEGHAAADALIAAIRAAQPAAIVHVTDLPVHQGDRTLE
jgi:hypothetical protein